MKQETKDKIKNFSEKTDNVLNKLGNIIIWTTFFLIFITIIVFIINIFKGQLTPELCFNLLTTLVICIYIIWSYARKNPIKVILEKINTIKEKIKNLVSKFKRV